MRSRRRFNGGRKADAIKLTLLLAILPAAGCDFEAVGQGGAPGIGCYKDLWVSGLAIDLTPSFDGLLVGGATPAPTNSQFLEFNHAFAIEWQYSYDGVFTPGPAKHASTTLVQILKNDVVVWETEIDAEPVDIGDSGTDAAYVWNGLPIGFYELRIELDPHDTVPECDDLVSVVDNTQSMTFNVWGSTGPPQNPTPCEESEDPNCTGDAAPSGR